MHLLNTEEQSCEYLLNKIKNIEAKMDFLMEKHVMNREGCLVQYNKRMKAEGQLLKSPVFTETKSQKAFDITEDIISIKSKRNWNNKVKAAVKEKTAHLLGSGVITFRNPKNTRGNSANAQAFMGVAIILLEAAKCNYKKNFISSLDSLLSAMEAYGIAKGKLDRRLPKETREIQKNEVQKEIIETMKRNPSLSSTGATGHALTNLGRPKAELRNARRLAPKRVKM